MLSRILIIMFLLLMSSPVYAGTEGVDLKIGDMFDPSNILSDIDRVATTLVATIRVLAAIGTTLLVVWVGFTLMTARDSHALEQVKSRLLFICVGLFLVFTTEPISRFILSALR